MTKLHIPIFINPNYQKTVMTNSDTSIKIQEIINNGKPAMISRFGCFEADCIAETIGQDLSVKKSYNDSTLNNIHRNAGVFPFGEKMAYRFSKISIDAAKKIDLLAAWSSSMQDYLIKEVCPKDMEVTLLERLEPFSSDNPWTKALKGKKVLVIHPFKNTIESQYLKREHLFEDKNVLPEFELNVMRSVQTSAFEKDDRFSDWEEALNYMYEEAMKYDFDVALIGCGAYGMPLAAKIKEGGKIAIHIGGTLQLFFGIKGGRWDNHPLSKLYNDYWVRPDESETPKKAKAVEGACYW